MSALTGRGKPGALKLMKKDSTYQETFSQLGQSWEVCKYLFDKIQLWQTRRGRQVQPASAMQRLPPQARSSSQLPSINLEVLPSDSAMCGRKSGWTTDGDGYLIIEWIRTPPAPDLKLLSCKCLRSCKLPSCTCLVNGLAPTCVSCRRAATRRKKNSSQLN